MPMEYRNLLAARDRVVERLIDYEIGSDNEFVQTLVAVQ